MPCYSDIVVNPPYSLSRSCYPNFPGDTERNAGDCNFFFFFSFPPESLLTHLTRSFLSFFYLLSAELALSELVSRRECLKSVGFLSDLCVNVNVKLLRTWQYSTSGSKLNVLWILTALSSSSFLLVYLVFKPCTFNIEHVRIVTGVFPKFNFKNGVCFSGETY